MSLNSILRPLRRVTNSNSVPSTTVQPGGRPASPVKMTRRDLQDAAIDAEMSQMLVRGFNIQQIARRFAVTPETVKRRVRKLLTEAWNETVENVSMHREMDLQRLEIAAGEVMQDLLGREYVDPKTGQKKVRPPDTSQVPHLVAIQTRKGKLLGTDSATKVEITPIRREYVGIDPAEV